MNAYQKFSGFIQGEGTLLIRCAEILLAQGHVIHGIIASNEIVQRWTQEHQIRLLNPFDKVAPVLQEQPFDYFFSIGNLSIVAAEILALPRKAAINFHDSLLPRYAGLHATSWALLNQESTHGITWHIMKETVDAGEIIKQREFPIEPDETALTLNSKCYEHGVSSFAELVEELATGNVQRQQQAAVGQSYFGKYDRPLAILRWNLSAREISALVRALDFGSYPNPLSLPKMIAGDEVFVVPSIEILQSSSSQPGTITGMSEGGLQVATATTEVTIERLLTQEGESVSIADFAARSGLEVGQQLPILSDEIAKVFATNNKAICRHEAFWLNRLQQITFPEIPYAVHSQEKAGQFASVDLPLSAKVLDFPDKLENLLLTVFSIFLARVSGNDCFDLGFRDSALKQASAGFERFVASHVPLHVAFSPNDSLETALEKSTIELATIRKNMTYARDVVVRYPELKTMYGRGAALPIVVEQVEQLDDYTPHSDSQFAMLVAGSQCRWIYDATMFSAASIRAMQHDFTVFLENLFVDFRNMPLAQIPLLSAVERQKVLVEWNATQKDYERNLCIHHLFERQVKHTPDAVALAFEDKQLTYRELNTRANQLAHYLLKLGVGPDQKVGLFTERSLDMMVGLLAILKAGGGYVPLDPTYPQDRIAFMIQDSAVGVLVTQQPLVQRLPAHQAQVVCIDDDWSVIAQEAETNPDSGAQPDNLCYMIYTSGSTGKPKGVMIEHRNVANFFAGIDDHITPDQAGVWLAVTSLSFDISVLELLWTLTRGFKVVLYSDVYKMPSTPRTTQDILFSLFYFASYDAGQEGDKYQLLLEGAKFADKHNFEAIWTPERHFGDFGGLFPNPAVTSAAIAALTEHVKIRAGSCVSPLHHAIRIAEDWALVDNLSKGRVGISFASGWQPQDFVLRPENFANRKAQMFTDINTVRKLWRGETVSFIGAQGEISIRTLPRPIQPELPTWVTIAGNPETFRQAGAAGYNVLTHLLGQTLEQLAEKLEAYHQAWRENGHSGRGHVTLMLHTFVGESVEAVREIVREPMIGYLGSALDLTEQAAWSFPAFKERAQSTGKSLKQMFDTQELTAEEKRAIFEHAFDRYFETSGLFGDVDTCLIMVDKLKAIGVNEIGCLIDFGVPTALALAHLNDLNKVREVASAPSGDYTIPALIARHGVTHLQCTPSMADMLTINEDSASALSSLKTLLIGGEAFPPLLAKKLQSLKPGEILNMYGPTETTIWSAVYPVKKIEDTVPIGKPIANTGLYILDGFMQPVPVGMPGELYIGGEGVVRGYWNRPELTEERFIPDPFNNKCRVYKTGDMARYLPDGNIEFLGRNDHQVKIRGYRIELGEIEMLLDKYPLVQKSVVIARENSPGDKRLVGYIVLANRQSPVANELREYLREHLPDFMVPSHFVTLESFPLTPNKKIDRKALPLPDQGRNERSESIFIPPQNNLEETIAGIWQELLGVPSVGTHDNFFDLGGHSILAVQAHRLIAEATGRNLNVTDLFRYTTVHTLANYLDQQDGPVPMAESSLDKSLSRAERRKQHLNRR